MKSQKIIRKYLLFFLLTSKILFGCPLCTTAQDIDYFVDIKTENKTIDKIKVVWNFQEDFMQQLYAVYDTNNNEIFEKDEMEIVSQTLYDYLIPRDYLTHISYEKIVNKKESIDINVSSKKIYIKDKIIVFEYEIDLDLPISYDKVLYLRIYDEEGFFVHNLKKDASKIDTPESMKLEGKDDIIFSITSDIENFETTIKDEKRRIEQEKKIEDERPTIKIYLEKLKNYLQKVKEGDTIALFSLIFISFVYGVFHAIGPGHGKSLAFSYFLANKTSYTKAFFISQASSFIHIIGALVLVLISIFLLQSLINNFVNDSIELITQISAFMIMALALYIFNQKLNNSSCSCSSCKSKTKTKNENTLLRPKFIKEELYFVLTAGLIPCPGTVVLFIYAYTLKTYFAVFLASVAISFGMGLVVFVSSSLGISLKKYSSSSHKMTKIVEILAPLFMFILGLLLFLNSDLLNF